MPRAPRVKGKQLISALGRLGFIVIRIKGSHHVLQHADGRMTVVPVHAGEVIGTGLLTKILADCEIDMQILREVL